MEASGAGCPGDDLGALILQECLIGDRPGPHLLRAYDAELARLDGGVPVSSAHLAWHTALRARWIAQWAIGFDHGFAVKVRDLTGRLLDLLDDPAGLR